MKRSTLSYIALAVALVACSSGGQETDGSAAQALTAPDAGLEMVDAQAGGELGACAYEPTAAEMAQVIGDVRDDEDVQGMTDAGGPAPYEVQETADAGVAPPTDGTDGQGCAPAGPARDCRCPEVTILCGDDPYLFACHPVQCLIAIPRDICTKLGVRDGDRKRQADLVGLPLKEPPVVADDALAVCAMRHEAVHACQQTPTTKRERNCSEADAYVKGAACFDDALWKYCRTNPTPGYCAEIEEGKRGQVAGHAYTACRCRGETVGRCAYACVTEIRCASKSQQEALATCGNIVQMYR